MICIHGDKIEEKWYNTKGCPVLKKNYGLRHITGVEKI